MTAIVDPGDEPRNVRDAANAEEQTVGRQDDANPDRHADQASDQD
jgi:hypothetical protein